MLNCTEVYDVLNQLPSPAERFLWFDRCEEPNVALLAATWLHGHLGAHAFPLSSQPKLCQILSQATDKFAQFDFIRTLFATRPLSCNTTTASQRRQYLMALLASEPTRTPQRRSLLGHFFEQSLDMFTPVNYVRLKLDALDPEFVKQHPTYVRATLDLVLADNLKLIAQAHRDAKVRNRERARHRRQEKVMNIWYNRIISVPVCLVV